MWNSTPVQTRITFENKDYSDSQKTTKDCALPKLGSKLQKRRRHALGDREPWAREKGGSFLDDGKEGSLRRAVSRPGELLVPQEQGKDLRGE